MKLIEDALKTVGLEKSAVKSSVGTKTSVVTHLASLDADTVCQALNSKMLGARILTSGASGEAQGPVGLCEQLRMPRSPLNRGILAMQCMAFATGILLPNLQLGLPQEASPGCFIVVVLLGHTLVRQATQSALACRVSIQFLMGLVLLGALYLFKFREAATVSLLVGGSEWMLGQVHAKVEDAMNSTLVGTATHATKVEAAGQKSVKIEDLRPGDVVLLRTGEVVPVDGEVLSSSALKVDESSVTGEALPVEKALGNAVSSGTVVTGGAGEIKCTAEQRDSFQGRMKSAVDEARSSGSRTEELVNKVAEVYTPLVVLGAIAVAVYTGSLTRGLATLVSACPCALVAAAPAAQSCTLVRLLSDLQVLVKETKALENLGKMQDLAVDKTGTLTEGSFSIADAAIMPGAKGASRTSLMRLLAAVESQDPHPLASSIVKEHVGCASEFDASGRLPDVSNFTRMESMGVSADVEGQKVGAGNAKYMEAIGVSMPPEALQAKSNWEAKGIAFTIIFMHLGQELAMVVCLEDQVRPDAIQALKELRMLGVRPALLTGDSLGPASIVAGRLGIEDYKAGCKPEDKKAWVSLRHGDVEACDVESQMLEKPLLPQGKSKNIPVVGMLGDGLNDGPALAAADVGIAVAAGLQLTMDAAKVVVNKGDHMLLRLALAVKGAQACHRLVVQNLVLACCIKLLALSLAATGYLSLSGGVLSDSGSFLVVLFNSIRPLWWNFSIESNLDAQTSAPDNKVAPEQPAVATPAHVHGGG